MKPAFGYRFEGGGRSVVISGDTRPCDNLVRWSAGVDCLIHECCDMTKTSWYPDCGWLTLEDKIRELMSYHTRPDDLGRMAAAAQVNKLAVTHLMPGSTAADLTGAAGVHYTGPVVVGEDLMDV